MVTIIIPTASRPMMLRTALQSIAEQTARHQIDRVYVSENGGNRESEQVCAEFPTLPVTYVFRVPMKPLEHAKVLLEDFLGESPYTAYLHDDDWWGPSHLKNALEALESRPEVGTYSASHFIVSGEISKLNCCDNVFPWFGSSYAPMSSMWELSRLNVLMAQLLNTMAHYSTLVVRTEILRKAAYVFDLGNPFDNDRMLIFALSTFAPFLYNPMPEVFIRNHAAQDCSSFAWRKQMQHQCETTRWMVEASGKSWEMIATCFAKRLTLCPTEAIPTLRGLAAHQWSLPELFRNVKSPLGLNEECVRKLRHIFTAPRSRRSEKNLHRFSPPKSYVPRKNWSLEDQTAAFELTTSLENMAAIR
jgi:hypothetical protein